MSSIYRRPEVKAALDRIYAEKLGQWPPPVEERYITTPFGPTHLLVNGPPDAPPLVLLPGMSVTALMWLPNIAAFSQHFRCYAVDVIGDYGRSELADPRRSIRTGGGYTLWMLDLLDGLELDQANILGASHGGYIALNLAADAPRRVARLILQAPSALTLTTSKVLPMIFRYLLFPNPANRERLITWLIGDHPAVHEAFYRQMWWGLQGRPKAAVPVLFPAARLKRITAPTLLLLGLRDPAIPAEAARRRAEKYIRHVQTVVVPDAGHALNILAPDFLEPAVVKFLQAENHDQ
jgi:pimeloyl-ACP methyl ester carboxylesterase